jgi:hypothetical protein
VQVLDDVSESSSEQHAAAVKAHAASDEYAGLDRDLADVKEQLDNLRSYPVDTDVVTSDNKYGTVLRVYPPAGDRNEVRCLHVFGWRDATLHVCVPHTCMFPELLAQMKMQHVRVQTHAHGCMTSLPATVYVWHDLATLNPARSALLLCFSLCVYIFTHAQINVYIMGA